MESGLVVPTVEEADNKFFTDKSYLTMNLGFENSFDNASLVVHLPTG